MFSNSFINKPTKWCMLILDPAMLPKVFMGFRVMHRIALSSNKDICSPPLLFISLLFLSPPLFLFLIAFAKTLGTVLNRSGESRHPFLHPPWSTGCV